MTTSRSDTTRMQPGRSRHSRAHRKQIKAALAGAYASLERQADPGSPAERIVARALRRASRAYDQLGESRVGQLLPNSLGRAVLITVPDGRVGA